MGITTSGVTLGSGIGVTSPKFLIIPNISYTTTTVAGTTYSFNYGSSLSAGTFVVITATVRSTAGADFVSIADNAGNTYTLAGQVRQTNNVTTSAIYYATLTNPVTTSNIITVTGTNVTYTTAKHAAVYVLSGVTQVDTVTTGQQTSTTAITQSTTLTNGEGIIVEVMSTAGLSGGVGFTSLSNTFIPGYVLNTVTGCAQYVAISTLVNQGAAATITNTMTMPSTVTAAAVVMASFRA